MAKLTEALSEGQIGFIARQRLYFVATAASTGRVNLSPKGMDTFRVISPTRVAYLDLTGSGNETAAHLQADGRITFMFCAFEGPPMILRLYGTGSVVRPGHEAWNELRPLFGPPLPGERQLIVADVGTVQASCGYGVPLYTYEADREQLVQWATRKGDVGLEAYRAEKNAHSIDGFPTGIPG
ncbi:MAG: pyridoxamine 5'-phosphate oxidase family protein [Flavobacteriales bacterium]|nr:pyridoxamine 5'-phosphate oxidase family protein [Flavobacteriales bacterium]